MCFPAKVLSLQIGVTDVDSEVEPSTLSILQLKAQD